MTADPGPEVREVPADDGDEPVIIAHEGNEYPEHAMTAADVTALIPKEVG